MVGGKTWGLVGGLILHGTVAESYTPIKSQADVVINMTDGEVARIMGGGFFSISKIEHSNGTTTAANLKDYINAHGGHSAFAVGGDVHINISGGKVTERISGGGGGEGSVDGTVHINISDNAVVNANIYGGARNDVGGANPDEAPYVGGSEINISGGTVTGKVFGGSSFDHYSAVVKGDSKVNISGGTVTGNVYGGGDQDIVKGDTGVTISGGEITGNVYGGGNKSTIEGDTNVTLSGGSISGTVYGTGEGDTVKGNVNVQILGGDFAKQDIVALADGATASGTYLVVGSENTAFNGNVGNVTGFTHIQVHSGSSITFANNDAFAIKNQIITLSAANLTKAAINSDTAVVGNGITLNFMGEGRLPSGKYMVINSKEAPEGWSADTVSVGGIATYDDLEWIGNTLYLTYRSTSVDAAILSNWGVFKSSQAFVSTLWGARDNVVSLDGPPATDEKGNVLPAPAEAKNIAWGTVYGMSGRISDAGADYSLYGMAVGAERKFGKNSSVGLALGYDWGKVSPFTTTNVDQESVHLALYGRVGEWKAGKGVVAVDWSAAVGDTTSEHRDYRGDWSQTSWQLDTRATYSRAINERTTASAFVGMQYYTHDSATADGVHVSGIENLRFQVGGGMSRKVSERTSVYGEASMYFDAMRDNPYAVEGGLRFKGTNPGRVGGKIGVGASYSINDKWSARGGYSFDVADDSTEHNVNVGATYKF
ncbi:MAG: autotransporter domain-containing protein [Akkermansia sp.]|nr:autotransporter domain-containing protein [Akkermansia sp.]